MNSHRFFRFIALIGVLVLCFSSLSLAGDPIPGIDISLQQVPGSLVKTVQTDKEGSFTFDKLQPGKYLVKLVPTQMKVKKYNASKSNTCLTAIASDGRTEVSISIILIETGPTNPNEPIEATIGAKGGKITGRVDIGTDGDTPKKGSGDPLKGLNLPKPPVKK